MAQVSDAVLYTYFEAGDQPTQQQFRNLIDSKKNVDEVNLSTEINIKAAGFNGAGDGIVDDVTAFLAANAALVSSGGGTIYVPKGTYRIADNLPFSDLVQIRMDKGAVFAPAGGMTISNVDLVSPPNKQIFAGAGTVTLKLGSTWNVKWWGATGDGTTNDYTNINRARTAIELVPDADLYYPRGTYVSGTSMTYGAGVFVRLASGAKLSPNTGTTLTFTEPPLLPFAQVFTGAGAISFVNPPPEVYPYWFGALGTGGDYTSAIQKTFNAMPVTGGKIVFTRSLTYYGVNTEIAVSDKNNLTVEGVGNPKIFLMTNTAWGAVSVHAFHFTDCSNVEVMGITFDGNGAANDPLVTELHFILAFDYTYANLLDDTRGIANINVHNCKFLNFFSSCIGVRSCDGVRVQDNVFLNAFQDHQTSYVVDYSDVHILRSDNVWVCRNTFFGGVGSSQTHLQRSCNVHVQMGGEISKWQPGINHASVLNYVILKTFTGAASASATPDTVVSYATQEGTASPTSNDFFFLCKTVGSGASAGYIPSALLKVTAVDTGAKTFTVRRMDGSDGAGSPTNWGGQVVYWCSLNTSRFAKNVFIHDNDFNHGASGVFLLGVKEYSITGNKSKDFWDSGIDVEWCMNGVIANNQVKYSGLGFGISILYFTRNLQVMGNVACSILQNTGFEMGNNIEIANNDVEAEIRCQPNYAQALDQVLEGMIIASNTIRNNITAGQVGQSLLHLGVEESADRGGMIRGVLIMGNRFRNCAQRGLTYQGVDLLTIRDNYFENIGYDAILDFNTATRQSTRVLIDGNILNNVGYRDFTTFTLFRTTFASTDVARIGPNNVWRNVDTTKDGTQLIMDGSDGSVPISNLSAFITWNPGNIADGAFETTTVTVTGARVGDFAQATFSVVLTDGMWLSAKVSADNTVTVTLHNESGGSSNLASGTLRVKVLKS